MKIKPTNISKEEKTRIFNESLKNQTPYTEKEPVKIQPVNQWISVKKKYLILVVTICAIWLLMNLKYCILTEE